MRPKAAENRGKSTAKREWNVINKTEGPKGMEFKEIWHNTLPKGFQN